MLVLFDFKNFCLNFLFRDIFFIWGLNKPGNLFKKKDFERSQFNNDNIYVKIYQLVVIHYAELLQAKQMKMC